MSQKTVMAVYDDRAQAQRAVQALRGHGFSHREVSLLAQSGHGDEGLGPYQPDAEETPSGAATGGMLGGLAGLLFGIGFLMVPGVGPMIAAGPIAATLVGAATGAFMGSMMDVLTDFGVPEDDAQLYAEAVRRGGTIVAVTAPPERVDSVTETLAEFAPVDLESRAQEWRSQGWSRYEEDAASAAAIDAEDAAAIDVENAASAHEERNLGVGSAPNRDAH